MAIIQFKDKEDLKRILNSREIVNYSNPSKLYNFREEIDKDDLTTLNYNYLVAQQNVLVIFTKKEEPKIQLELVKI